MSEEKTLPASERKLLKAREEGQVAHSRDLSQTLTLGALMLYFFFVGGSFIRDLVEGFEALRNVEARELDNKFIVEVMQSTIDFAIQASLMPLIIGSCVALLVSVVDTRGIVFSLKPITPDFTRLDPIKGLGNMFGPQGLTYLFFNFLKATLILILSFVFLFVFLPVIKASVTCDVACGLDATVTLSWWLSFICFAILFISIIFEFPLSRMFFQEEMKMTHTELKQEIKDMLGDAHIRQARRGVQEESLHKRVGARNTNLVISAGTFCVGIFYERGQTPAPVLTFKGYDQRGKDLTHEAILNGAREVSDADLAEYLIEQGSLGEFVPRLHFDKIALHLVEAGVIQV